MKSSMNKTRIFTVTAMLAGVSALLMYLEFPIPFLPPFLKMDFSDVPALIGAFALGPISGVVVVLIKNLVHILSTQTGGIGELANFVIAVSLILPAGIIYRFSRTLKGAIIGMLAGTVFMCAAGVVFNYLVLIPMYINIMGLDAVVGAAASANGAINNLFTMVIYGIAPFNLIKGILVSIVTMLLYKKLAGLIKNFHMPKKLKEKQS